MSTFRKYAFDRFAEANRQPLLPGFDTDFADQPEEPPAPQRAKAAARPKASPAQQPNFDALSEIIHAVPLDKAAELLQAMNIGRRGGLNKKNFEPFKRRLLALVAHVSPAVVRHVLAGDAQFFKPVVEFWKSHTPPPAAAKPLSFAADGPTERGEVEDEVPNFNLTQPTMHPKVALGDRVEHFPPSGADLTHRLAWAMQMEEIGGRTLYEAVRHYLTANGFHPKTMQYRGDTETLVKNHLSGGDVRIEPHQQGQLRSGLVALDNGILQAIAEDQISHKMLSDLIDNLIHTKFARIRGDELQALARIWLNQSQAGLNKYSLTEPIAKKLIVMFNNQRMMEWFRH